MIRAAAAALLALVLGPADASKQVRPRAPEARAVTVRGQVIIRVSTGAGRAIPAMRWDESRGPRCVATNRIVGAALLGQNSVDLIFRDNSRVRARLERRCPALDYYRGFYVEATQDGRICADRDSIRSRTGGECQIDQFRALTATPR
jgi:hypothetical protein